MTPDDAHTSHNHGFELPNAPRVVVHSDPRPWRAVAGVAVCLGLAGIVTGLIVARRQSTSDQHITSDALQREELRDGWRTLIAAAARDAENDVTQADAPANAAATAAPASAATVPNVVIVNVPAQGASAAPPNVTNINLPNGATNGSSGTGVPDNSNLATGYTPIQSLPAINYSPVQGYLPNQAGYPLPPASNTPQPSGSPQNGYGTPPGSVAPSVGNGSIPGSTPNPALPNNGLVGSSPTGSPNGSNSEVTPGTPVGAATSSPSTPSLPSGFSAP
jgi:hypothetical protein